MMDGYELVELAGGVHSIRSRAFRETFHPVIGPAAEARALYVEQLALPKRIVATPEPFVIWDIGLGAAANPLTLLANLPAGPFQLRLISFDNTVEPLRFALGHAGQLPFLRGWESPLELLLHDGHVAFTTPSGASIHWELYLSDFPSFLASPAAAQLPKPHAVFYDAYSPATNPDMWTASVFRNLFRQLDPARPCSMPTYSRSTMLRATLLIAGFFVGRGHATGEKEETTIAANSLDLIAEPLGPDWLARAERSTSAEPLDGPPYRQAPLSKAVRDRLRGHPQFNRRVRQAL